LKVKTNIIANISVSPIGYIIMCFMSDWHINLHMRVTNLLIFLWIKVSSVIKTLSKEKCSIWK